LDLGRPVTPDLPIEFVVEGVAVSLQASAPTRAAWRETIRAAGAVVVPGDAWALTERVAVTIYYFPEGAMIGDVDNIVKPILDAMTGPIYVDDRQVERVVVQKFEPDNVFSFSNPSQTLVAALAKEGAAVYIRVIDDPHEDLQ
jgi:crossover junction endodeoxyribonuclease RusA